MQNETEAERQENVSKPRESAEGFRKEDLRGKGREGEMGWKSYEGVSEV